MPFTLPEGYAMSSNATEPTTTMLIVTSVISGQWSAATAFHVLSNNQLQLLPRCRRNCFGIGQDRMRQGRAAFARPPVRHSRNSFSYYFRRVLGVLQQNRNNLI